jgi:ubiquinone/menaquinone biosynthesis C-methylase UbiE
MKVRQSLQLITTLLTITTFFNPVVMPANFNNAAPFYDRLSRLVYGRAVINAQVYLMQFIPVDSKVLIVGGGTGWILEEITNIYPSGLNVTYVEVSAKMVAISKKRNAGANKVVFINGAIENIALPADFNVVITPFLFDNFTEQTVQQVFNHIRQLLRPGGLWLNCDFQLTGKWWQGVLLRSMILFFRIVCNIEASRLPDVETHFDEHDYKIVAQQTFYGDFIISKVWCAIEP